MPEVGMVLGLAYGLEILRSVFFELLWKRWAGA